MALVNVISACKMGDVYFANGTVDGRYYTTIVLASLVEASVVPADQNLVLATSLKKLDDTPYATVASAMLGSVEVA